MDRHHTTQLQVSMDYHIILHQVLVDHHLLPMDQQHSIIQVLLHRTLVLRLGLHFRARNQLMNHTKGSIQV